MIFNLDHWTVSIERLLPDSVFNYAFIVKAFASGNTSQEKAAEGNSQWTFELGNIHLVNIRAHYKDDATGNDAHSVSFRSPDKDQNL